MNILLIANPVSGGDARPRIAHAAAWLRARGATVEVCLTQQRGDARRLAEQAREGNVNRVVVAGGDGTLNEVANGLCGSDLPLAFLPLGTVNVFALETGIPLELEQACRLAVEGQPRRISLGRINGESFLLMASSGWDAESVARVRPAVKRRIGRLAYGVSAMETLLAKTPAPLQVTLADGSRHEGFGMVVSNARHYAGHYVVTPNASLDTAQLELCLFKRGGRLAMLGYALRLGLRLPLRPPAVAFFSIDAAEITGSGVPVQVDGDAWGTLPVTVVSQPNALSVVLP
ncbi:MAG: diacylglycerol kinase family lipid kinase [Desulfuromonadales bacterium]|nr:diacylglycerol kinase family lipid kinase [Desulfuromonadales bacterium]